jgi:cytosolic iron-sulfur protein assembly protein CIAO1
MLNGAAEDDEFEFSVSAILSGHTQDVKFVKWHPTENLLFSASYDNTIKCWEYSEAVDDWLCAYTITGHRSTIWQLDFSPDGSHLCACSEDMTWSVWEITRNSFKNKGMVPGQH